MWTQRWPPSLICISFIILWLLVLCSSMMHCYTCLVILSTFWSAWVAWKWCVHDIFYCSNCTTKYECYFIKHFTSKWPERLLSMKKSFYMTLNLLLIDTSFLWRFTVYVWIEDQGLLNCCAMILRTLWNAHRLCLALTVLILQSEGAINCATRSVWLWSYSPEYFVEMSVTWEQALT